MSTSKKESASYKDMMSDVETILNDISSPQMELDELVQNVEKGYELIKSMRQRLGDVKEKMEKLHSDFSETQS